MSSSKKTPTYEDIIKAQKHVSQFLHPTPYILSPKISDIFKSKIHFKLENFNYTGSFKERGVINKFSTLTADQKKNGVIALSAGNHAQALAYYAQKMNIPAVIVMPESTPFNKIENTEKFGAEVILNGKSLSDSEEFTANLAKEKNLTLVHPYDDLDIIAGQGTIGLELLHQAGELDTVIVPIGGGGLISGIAIALKEKRPEIKIIGVESEMYPSMSQTLAHEEVKCGGVSIADGIAVKNPGHYTRHIIEKYVDQIIVVDELSIEKAIEQLAVDQKVITEGAGAAGFAAILKKPEKFQNKNIAIILCGGNVDRRIMSSIYLRGLTRSGRLVRLRIKTMDSPGVMADITTIIAKRKANIVEISHKRLLDTLTVREANLELVLETKNKDHIETIIKDLKEVGYQTELLSEVN